VDAFAVMDNLIVTHSQGNGLLVFSAGRFNFGVAMHGSRNGKGIPGAIGPIGFILGVHPEWRGYGRERKGHLYPGGTRVEINRVKPVQVLYRNDTLFGAGSLRGTDAITLFIAVPLLVVAFMIY